MIVVMYKVCRNVPVLSFICSCCRQIDCLISCLYCMIDIFIWDMGGSQWGAIGEVICVGTLGNHNIEVCWYCIYRRFHVED